MIMDIRKALQEPLENLNSENVLEIFEQIAKNLFDNFYIQCDTTKYYFTEIEFYYFKKGVWCDNITYERGNRKVGDLFYHLSGVDICFDCSNNEYGGILIRSMKKINKDKKEMVNGPLNCLIDMLNSCENGQMPHLMECIEQKTFDILFSKRINLGKVAKDEYRNILLRAVLCDDMFKDGKYLYKPQMIKGFLLKQKMTNDQKNIYAKEKLGYVPSALK